MTLYKLGFEAENDILNIVTYTAGKWGIEQARVYSETLAACMEKLALKEPAYKQLNAFSPPILVKHCKHHYIFGQQTVHDFVIIAVLHERMDFISRIKERLE